MYGCLLLSFLFLPVFLFYALMFFLRTFLGLRRTARQFTESTNGKNPKNEAEKTEQKGKTKNGRKNFDRDEGEYIDFEEIKN